MLKRIELIDYLDKLLKPKALKDYCHNGLQVEGTDNINKIITGVSASENLINQAIDNKADALLVHHGILWQKDDGLLVGAYKRKIALLLKHNINLLAYHLPLDVHAELGNNAELGKLLDFVDIEICDVKPSGLLWKAKLKTLDTTGAKLAQTLTTKLNHRPLHIQAKTSINSVAWCTGAAQHFIKQAHQEGVDAFISGEISENTVHFAIENNIHYFSAGHHATEKGGVNALGKNLAQTFNIEHKFIDIPIAV